MQYSLSKTFSVIYTKLFFQRAPKISFQEKYHRKIYTWQSWLYKKYFSWQLFYLQNLQSVETGLTLTPVPNKNSHEGKVSSDMFAVASTEIKMQSQKRSLLVVHINGCQICYKSSNGLDWNAKFGLSEHEFSVIFGHEFQLLLWKMCLYTLMWFSYKTTRS